MDAQLGCARIHMGSSGSDNPFLNNTYMPLDAIFIILSIIAGIWHNFLSASKLNFGKIPTQNVI